MTNHVPFTEMNKRNSRDASDHFERLNQSGTLPAGQVNLRNISSDHGLGIEPQAGEKHLHLFAGGVLRFIQNHEGVVERAASHEGQRSNFNDSLFEESLQLIG